MKALLLITCLLATSLDVKAGPYDGTIKDNYNRTVGYVSKQGNRTYFVDVYGRRGNFILKDGKVKDKYNRTLGSVKK